jgi:hypothetical protein
MEMHTGIGMRATSNCCILLGIEDGAVALICFDRFLVPKPDCNAATDLGDRVAGTDLGANARPINCRRGGTMAYSERARKRRTKSADIKGGGSQWFRVIWGGKALVNQT